MTSKLPPFHVFSLLLLLLVLSSQLAAAFGVWINGDPPSPDASSAQGQGGGKEYAALQAVRAAVVEDPRGALASWQGPNVCAYKGVYCSAPPDDAAAAAGARAVVAGIDLNRASLRGTLPAAVSLLAHLTFLHLNSNRLSGAVPDSLRDLQYLTELDLSNNLFSGPFPAATLLIPSLVYLDLRFNAFSGQVPAEAFAKNLDALFLNNNQFDGQIPETLWSSPATVITLANNRLTGPVPTAYGYGAGGRVREVLFLNNKLTGCIPEELGFLPNIEVLDLSYNSLSGHLPTTLSCLSGIEVLNIAHNQFTGELPDLVCDLKRITNLSVSFNFFSGISQHCDRLAGRSVFDFVGNCIPGRGLQRPPPECDGAPGDAGLSCLRIPVARPVPCTTQASVSVGVGVTVGGSLPSFGAGGVVTVTVP
ncbi:leucine-rich repeat extensin-like protein 6 [Oryza brachyantha]|uniref:leucine-rich repeat extensin-like protein 6 n=1 Tax=Oryza brachyantha TaxID=4533 RepID=UPI001AD9CAF1|nr:leucine-rich repeat extensin-like protein 6 [Oryza brachyantha]